MNFSDVTFITQWWSMFFIVGIIFLPITNFVFGKFFDKGYIFAKIIGIVLISYLILILAILKLFPFTLITIDAVIIGFLILNILLILKYPNILKSLKKYWRIFVFEEILFIITLLFWSFVRVHQPDIHGLEKYMDFGFINSILKSEYFPPHDMWLTPHSINYYYFGHLVTAVLTKLSVIPSFVTFNLMLSTIFAFTFAASFSIGFNLFNAFLATTELQKKRETQKFSASKTFSVSVIAGFLSGLITSLAGNLHTLFAFFKPYVNENPVPFWQLAFSPNSFPNSYWYPNATRFIHNTIHEFPIYSSVVSDLHGHFLDVPFVLLSIAILFSILMSKSLNIFKVLSLSFLLAVMYMTNAWDGIIYYGLSALVIIYLMKKTTTYLRIGLLVVCIFIGSILFSLPFNLFFKPFASGIGILCAPEFLTNIGKIGPFLFEKDHCQHSPWWQLLTLYGFFYFWAVSFFFFIFKKKEIIQSSKFKLQHYSSKFKIFNFKLKLLTFNLELLTKSDIFVLILIIFSTFLIIIPEFIYIKDIYPGHYRANTMFKLVYQAFIMLSIASAYIAIRLIFLRSRISLRETDFKFVYWKLAYWIIGIIGLFLVMIYPYFAINSYYNLKTYQGLDGIKYLKTLYPTDYEGILWINKNIKGQPVILEAQGDSYTDYARVSTNTGLPTILGWTVHEWLWRGSYDIPSPRIVEVAKMYESQDLEETKSLLKKYNVRLVFVGSLEKEKYPNLNEEKFKTLGKAIYQNGNTKIYNINKIN